MSDNIVRILEFLGYKVKQVMNITDIDDKTIRNSGKAGMSLDAFTKKWTVVFFDGLKKLNIKKAWKYPKARRHVRGMIKLTKALVNKGYAYERNGSVYFDISKFKNYGKLSKVDLKKIKIGAAADVDEYDKDSPQDFALLKKSTPKEVRRGIYYKTEWGNVRPGWHIECSVMSMKFFGKTFDIHTGGVDLIFPHHENEIAQSEAYTGKRFVKYWLHGEHLMVNGRKMSKSLGNYFTLNDLVDKFGPEIVRYMFVSTHYREKLNYTGNFAENAKSNYGRLQETYGKLKFGLRKATGKKTKSDQAFLKKLPKFKKKFTKVLEDDFNNPLAMSVFHQLAREINKYLERGRNRRALKEALKLFNEMSEVFGLKFKVEKKKLPKQLMNLIKQREKARKQKDWKKADAIRRKLKKKGILLEDTPKGIRWKKIK